MECALAAKTNPAYKHFVTGSASNPAAPPDYLCDDTLLETQTKTRGTTVLSDCSASESGIAEGIAGGVADLLGRVAGASEVEAPPQGPVRGALLRRAGRRGGGRQGGPQAALGEAAGAHPREGVRRFFCSAPVMVEAPLVWYPDTGFR